MMKKYIHLKTIVFCITLLITGFKSTSAQQKKGLLWEITGKGMKQPAYLFGTIHIYDTTAYELPQAPFELLNKVKKAYFELDFAHIDYAEIGASMFIKDSSQTIDKLLDAASFKRLQEMVAASKTLQMLGPRVYSIKPFMLLSMLMGNENATSVDMELYNAAVSKKDSVGGLETLKEQLGTIDAISIPVQIDMLRESLEKGFSPKDMMADMTAMYVKQDVEHLLTAMNENTPVDINFNEKMVTERNIKMADRIDVILHTESPLFAVGGGHLGSPTGLIALLEKKGYKLKNVPFKIKKAHP